MKNAISEYSCKDIHPRYNHHYEFDIFTNDDEINPASDALNTMLFSLHTIVNAENVTTDTSWKSTRRRALTHLMRASEVLFRELI